MATEILTASDYSNTARGESLFNGINFTGKTQKYTSWIFSASLSVSGDTSGAYLRISEDDTPYTVMFDGLDDVSFSGNGDLSELNYKIEIHSESDNPGTTFSLTNIKIVGTLRPSSSRKSALASSGQ